jgi:hypothetical protein
MAIKRKNALYRKFMKSKLPADQKKYGDYKRILRSLLRGAERKHYEALFDKHKSNLRKSWGVIKEILNKKRHDSTQNKLALTIDGKETSDPELTCSAFNKYFVSVGPNLASKIPHSGVDPLSFMGNAPVGGLFLGPTSNTEIQNILMSLKNCAPGPDDIPPSILKDCSEPIIDVLVHTINLSFTQGKFPKELKVAKVAPLFKSGDPCSVNNYRPISLLSSF